EEVLFWRADLGQAYADAGGFGYARLALLERALSADAAVAAVVRDEGQVRFGVAAPARLAGEPAVAYARLPLRTLTAGLEQVALPEGTYLALRQGGYNVSERGAGSLSGSADALSRVVGKTGLRTAAAVPDAGSAPFQLGATACIVAAV